MPLEVNICEIYLYQCIIAVGRWRVCFWVATIPATLQALGMEFCAESPQWLYKVLLLWHIA